MEAIDVLNADERAVNGSAVFGVNIFADLSTEEFTNYLGLKIPADDASRQSLMEVAPAAVDLYPNLANLESVDWRGIYTTPIKDQGQCGACWYTHVD